jgi:hypothetical protein
VGAPALTRINVELTFQKNQTEDWRDLRQIFAPKLNSALSRRAAADQDRERALRTPRDGANVSYRHPLLSGPFSPGLLARRYP